MRITVLILTILGALLSISLGTKWLSDAAQYKELASTVAATGELDRIVRAAYALWFAAVIGLAAGIFTFRRGKNLWAVGALLIAVAIPAMFFPKTLIVTFFFAMSAAFASKARLKTPLVPAA